MTLTLLLVAVALLLAWWIAEMVLYYKEYRPHFQDFDSWKGVWFCMWRSSLSRMKRRVVKYFLPSTRE